MCTYLTVRVVTRRSIMQNPRLIPARVEVQGSSHQATVWGQPYRYRLPGITDY